MNYLAKNLAEFFNILRTAGMNISVSDCLTAVEALLYVDITSRSEVKTALKACLVKDAQGQAVFSRAFDLYFVPDDIRKNFVENKAQLIEKRKQEIEEAAKSLKFQGNPVELTEDFKEVFAGLPDEEKKGLEDFLKATSAGKNVRSQFRQLAESMVRSRLSGLKHKYHEQLKHTMGVLSYDTSDAGIIAGEVAEAVSEAAGLLQKNIGEISDDDVPAAIRLITLMVDKLKKELSRKYRNKGRNRLDLKRTIRNNLSTGQVLFKLKFKSRTYSKNKLLLLCDVSASMYRFSGFVIHFMAGMSRGFMTLESYIFSEDVEKINIKSYYGPSDFENQVKSGKIWGKGTNIGIALRHILKNRMAPISSSTVLVIVSDAKTQDYKLAENSLKEISNRVKKILWLNPLPEKDWVKIKGLDGLSKYCSMLDCSTLERLATACRSL